MATDVIRSRSAYFGGSSPVFRSTGYTVGDESSICDFVEVKVSLLDFGF